MVSELQVKIADFLNINFVSTKFLIVNLWHVIHFISGGIVMFLILKFSKKSGIKKKFLMLLILLALYEMFELAFILSGSDFFRGETSLDVFWDIFLGLLGGILVFRFRKSLLH